MPQQQHSEQTRRRAVDLVRGGATAAAAAAAVGADRSSVYAWLHRLAPELVRPRPMHRCWRCCGRDCPEPAAYAHLLGLYLGDGWLARAGPGSWSLNVACCDSYPRLSSECEGSMLAVLATNVCRVPRAGCHDVKSYSRHWACLFPQHGPGRKHERRILLEPWQQAIVDAHPGRLLRGLFHSDGWRGDNVAVHRRGGQVVRYRYTRYEFTNRSPDVRLCCTQALDSLGIAWRPNGRWRISVAQRDAVARLDEHVGSKA